VCNGVAYIHYRLVRYELFYLPVAAEFLYKLGLKYGRKFIIYFFAQMVLIDW